MALPFAVVPVIAGIAFFFAWLFSWIAGGGEFVYMNAISFSKSVSLDDVIKQYNVPDETIKRLKDSFAYIDLDGDGVIEYEESSILIKKLRVQTNKVLPDKISFDQYAKLMIQLIHTPNDFKKTVDSMFDFTDTNDNDVVEWTEFLHLMRSTEFKITKEEITENFHSLDTNSDDKLTREEFEQIKW